MSPMLALCSLKILSPENKKETILLNKCVIIKKRDFYCEFDLKKNVELYIVFSNFNIIFILKNFSIIFWNKFFLEN